MVSRILLSIPVSRRMLKIGYVFSFAYAFQADPVPGNYRVMFFVLPGLTGPEVYPKTLSPFVLPVPSELRPLKISFLRIYFP
jgi:hypothetical protein